MSKNTYYVFYDSRPDAIEMGEAITKNGHTFWWVNEIGELISLDQLIQKSNTIDYNLNLCNKYKEKFIRLSKNKDAVFIIDLSLNRAEHEISRQFSAKGFMAHTARRIIEILREGNSKSKIIIVSNIEHIEINDRWKKSLSFDALGIPGKTEITFKNRLFDNEHGFQKEWRAEHFEKKS